LKTSPDSELVGALILDLFSFQNCEKKISVIVNHTDYNLQCLELCVEHSECSVSGSCYYLCQVLGMQWWLREQSETDLMGQIQRSETQTDSRTFSSDDGVQRQ
jgi:hypothetical protein